MREITTEVYTFDELNDKAKDRARGIGSKELTVTTYGLNSKAWGLKVEKKTSGHVYANEHPQGDLLRKCTVCGYAYGSAWLKEDVPVGVLEFLEGLPDSDRTPAWC